MRHRVARRKLNRTSEHRLALRRNMAQSLFEHGQIQTTLTKAKDLRPFVERLITLARKARGGDLAARQRLTALLGDRSIIPAEYQDEYENMSDAARRRAVRSRSGRRYRLGQARGGRKFTAVSVIHHLINNIAGEYEDRPGGYTRVIKLGKICKGDSAPKAVLQLVGEEESPGTVTRAETNARKRRAKKRYATAAALFKQTGRKSSSAEVEVKEDIVEDTAVTEEPASGAESESEGESVNDSESAAEE